MKIEIPLFAVIAIFLSLPHEALAIEVQNPKALCERFLTSGERLRCEDQMKELKPDWYLAGVCNKQFEDKAFYDCLNLSKTAQFSPQKLEACEQADTTDEVRMDCIHKAEVSPAQAFQATAPTAPRAKPLRERISERH